MALHSISERWRWKGFAFEMFGRMWTYNYPPCEYPAAAIYHYRLNREKESETLKSPTTSASQSTNCLMHSDK